MAGDKTIYLLCAGICLVVIIVVAIIIAIFITTVKRRVIELENDKQALDVEKRNFAFEHEQLKKAQDDLKNAQILFQKEKEAKNDLSKKTEKEVAIDLFIKFIEMESTFEYMKNNLASIDSKLVGVKNYSEDLASLKNELTTHIGSLKAEMTDMQKSYSAALTEIHSDLKTSLSNIESHIEGIVSSITGKEMTNLVRTVNYELDKIKGTVEARIVEFSCTMDRRMQNLSSEFGTQIENHMPSTIDKYDIERAVENVLGNYTISSLDEYDVENAVRNVVDNTFSYSYDFEDRVKSAVHSEMELSLSEIKSEISNLGYELSDIKSSINK